jgi:hypothetical protein
MFAEVLSVMSLFKSVLTVPCQLQPMSSSLAACPRHILDLDLIETLTEQTTSACAFSAPLNTRMEYDLNSTCHGMDFTVQTALSLFIFPDLLFYPCLS